MVDGRTGDGTAVNARAGGFTCKCKITSCKIILRLNKLIKTGLSSSAAILKVVIEGL